MKMLFIIPTLIMILQGCVTTSQNTDSVDVKNKVDKQNQVDIKIGSSGYGYFYTFNGKKSRILSGVISQMADQLLNTYDQQFENESIALTSLVDLNNNENTSWLGQTISEQFIHELHIRKLRVVDYKLMGKIQMTPQGEFAITRDWEKLNNNVDVTRILTGTLSRNEEGVIVNVRIVNASSNVVESTSSAFIPNSVFVGGSYDYTPRRYISRNSERNGNQSLVSLVQ
tara:strand:+ start:92 stop:772 length:681 start_codon:yes stop_codon:yes gene_type:complete